MKPRKPGTPRHRWGRPSLKKTERRILHADFQGATRKTNLVIERTWRLAATIDLEQFMRHLDRYYSRIHIFLYHGTGDRQLAADLAAETFRRAHDRLWRFRFSGISFGAWVFRIAAGLLETCLNKKFQLSEVLPGDLGVIAGEENVAEHSKSWRRFQQLLECMSHLDTDMQIMLILFYWENMRVEEIATICGRKESVVKMVLHQGRARLRRDLLEMAQRKPVKFPPHLEVIDGRPRA